MVKNIGCPYRGRRFSSQELNLVKTIYQYSRRELRHSDTLFWPPRAPGIYVVLGKTFIHKVKLERKKKKT